MITPDGAYYASRFKDAYNGNAWFGENMLTKLGSISEEQLFEKPNEILHSVAEIVSHIIYWRSPLVKRLLGDSEFTGSMKSPENWISLDALKIEGRETLLQRLHASQNTIVTLLPNQSADFFYKPYSDTATNRELVEGIIDHDIYHLGQIALIIKTLKK